MRIIFCVAFLGISALSSAQLTLSVEGTPKFTFLNYQGSGIIPTGFFLKRVSPSLSFAALIGYKLKNRVALNAGLSYSFDNYRTRYYRETENNKWPVSSQRTTLSFYEPKVILTCSPRIFKSTKFYFSTGLGYQISGAHNVIIRQSIYVDTPGKIDTVSIDTYISSLNTSALQRLNFYYELGRSKEITDSGFTIYLGVMGKCTSDEGNFNKRIIDQGKVNTFNYHLNSSFVGLNLRFTYNSRIGSKPPEQLK